MFRFVITIDCQVNMKKTILVIEDNELNMKLEAISKKGFWFKVKAGPSFNPQAYSSMSRT
jgi:hypothetical protein